MKVLKFLLILIGILLAIGIIAGLVLPKSYIVERSIEIDAPKDVIFEQVVNLKNQQKWSPWEAMDPNMKHEFVGEDGTVGFIAKWEGNKDVGKGEQEIKAIKVNERVETELRFKEPREDKGTGYFNLEDGEKGTKVTWGMSGPSPFPGNVFMAIMNIDKMLGTQFEKGLASLKEIAESAKNTAPKKYEIQTIDLPELIYVGVRKELNVNDLQAFFAKNFGALSAAMAAKKAERSGMPSALYFTFDEETMDTDMAAVFPVKKPIDLGNGFTTFKFPASKALRIDYYGDYNGLGTAHEALEAYIEANKLTSNPPAIEEYVTDPGEEKDPSKWLTKVTYLIGEKGK